MSKTSKQKNLLIGGLLAVVLIMAIGYAAFATQLNINGTANIDSSWCVGFKNTNTSAYEATPGKEGATTPTGSISFSGDTCATNYQTNASLTAAFKQPGDKIVYTLTIGNKSTFKAAIKSIKVENEDVTSNKTITKGNIKYTVEMPETTTLEKDAETTMKVIAEFQNDTDIEKFTGTETQTLSVQINAEQDDGTGGFTPTPAAQAVYAINTGKIYKDSSSLEDIGTTYNSCSATGKNYCLKYTIEDNTVTGADVCFVKGGTEYCLKGWVDECLWDDNVDNGNGACTFTGTPAVFNSNKSVLQSAFTEENACVDSGSDYYCLMSAPGAGTTSLGDVVAVVSTSDACTVYSDGYAACDGFRG